MYKNIAKCVLVFFAALFLSGCGQKMESEDFFAMDTVMQLQLYGAHAEDALKAARQKITELDALLSISNSESDICRVNAGHGGTVSEETARLVERAISIGRKTGGAFDITIAPVMELWGFYGDEQKVPDEASLKEALSHTGDGCVSLEGNELIFRDDKVKIDLGGIAKGWAAGKAADIIKSYGITSAVLSLGGNVRLIGSKPDGSSWNVGIVDPLNQETQAAVVKAEDCSVVTSGGYQRYFEENGKRYHHIIDPKTGKPAESGLLSVTIITKDDTLADALSTAVFVMGEEKALKFWQDSEEDFELLLVTDDLRVVITKGLEGLVDAKGDYVLETAG